MAALTVPPQGIVISTPGTYILTAPAFFTASFSDAPSECLDSLSGAVITGILITANNVTIDLAGRSLGMTVGAATLSREFCCVRISGASNVKISNGTIGRATSFGVIAEKNASGVTLENLKLTDFERGGVMLTDCQGGARVTNCVVGPNFQGRRPSATLSLAARYLPVLTGLSADDFLRAELLAALTSGPVRSDLGLCVGVYVRRCAGLIDLENIVVSRISQRPVQVLFLAQRSLPRGPLNDPISAGDSETQQTAQHAAFIAGSLAAPDQVPTCPPPTVSSPCCSTTATNLGVCSSCSSSVARSSPSTELIVGLDGFGEDIVGVVGVKLESLVNYKVSNITVNGLQSSLGKSSNYKCSTMTRTTGTRARTITAQLLILNSFGGNASNIPEPLLVQSERLPGAPCTLPFGFSAAWFSSSNSQQYARPVGNVQNVQVVPAFLPSLIPSCVPR